MCVIVFAETPKYNTWDMNLDKDDNMSMVYV